MKQVKQTYSKANSPRRTAKPPKPPGRVSSASQAKYPSSGGNSRYTPAANGKR